jgi:endonuclease/exonuclease/phosphatase family metal-dependent hydrolase
VVVVRTKKRKDLEKARLVYYNFGDGPDNHKLADLEYGSNVLKADIIAVSEHADRIDVTTSFLESHPDWARYYGDGENGAAKECILYRKNIGKKTLEKTVGLTRARKLPKGAGPENAGPKWAHWLRFRRKHHRLHLIVAHQYATVANRREAAWDFIRSLAKLVRPRMGVTIFFGDLNATLKDVTIRFFKQLFSSSSAPKSGPTHEKRLIDYINIKGGVILGVFTVKRSSDHKMLVVDALI